MKQPKPMWEDPGEDALVRELLDAGRESTVTDYDFEAGLSQHLEHVAAGTPAPEWARELLQAGGSTTGSTVAATGATGAGGVAVAAWIAGPILLAGAVTAGLLWTSAPPVQETPSGQGHSATLDGATGRPAAHAPPTAPAVAAPASELGAPVAPGPAAKVRALEEQVEAAVRHAPADKHGARAERGHRKATGRTKLGGQARAKRPAASPKSPGVEALMAQPRQAPRRAGAAASGAVAPASANAVAAAGEAESARADAQPPAEDLNTKWARGVYADQADDATEDRLEREMRMLKVAQAALRSNPQRALQLARRGEREYGASMFEAERQHVLILALVKLGRLTEARRVAKPYLAKYPRGPFTARVKSALATGRVGQ